jgi:2-polyprenyl-3-methyl-5-hydroxy-6-metoxy-1,4-benzoquinol methylase
VSGGYRERLYARYRSGQSTLGVDDRRARGPYLRRIVRRHFPPDRDARILDLGCGSGTLLHFLREAGYRNLRGVDGSAEQVEAARGAGITCVEAGELADEIARVPAGSLDVVVTWDVVEHLGKDELLAFADEVRRSLGPRGRWVLHVPNAESPFGSRVRYADLTHEQAFTRESLAQLAHAAGLACSECHEDEPVVHGPASLARWIAWRVVRLLLRAWVFAETGDPSGRAIFSQNLTAVFHRE